MAGAAGEGAAGDGSAHAVGRSGRGGTDGTGEAGRGEAGGAGRLGEAGGSGRDRTSGTDEAGRTGGVGEAGGAERAGAPTRPASPRRPGDTARAGGAATPLPMTTLGAFLTAGGFSPYFVAHFITPLVSAIWSCDARTALRYPASYLFRFLDHHGLLSVGGSPTWRTVTGGSRSYVERIGKQLTAVRTATPVHAVTRGRNGVTVTTDDGGDERFDSVVIAVHPGQALRLLADATDTERDVLGAFPYSRNPALLHTDTSVLPAAPGAAASWNMRLPACEADAASVRISYDMNRLQRLDAPERYVVTLNGAGQVDDRQIVARMDYEHPVYTQESVAAQRLLPGLNSGVTAYAGAYHGWGFHEDGCRSGVRAAASLGVVW
ncbi:FAD-dependent oxidoreductase [Streptomyces sp. NPDC047002]|uniref:NAD(P)/FAD-dependent oxidoreductase n=1 Tax=Streptomyces sp. NPDC047002 TaxID=3155475 RepID=UPI00345646C5